MSSFTKGAKVQRKSAVPSVGVLAELATEPGTATSAAAASSSSSITAPLPAPTSINTATPIASVPVIRPTAAGCRSWIHSLTLTSSGVSSIDAILGGGIALGSIVLMKDASSDQQPACLEPFMTSFVADGIGYGHRVMIAHPGSRSILSQYVTNLPRNTTIEKRTADSEKESQILAESSKQQEQLDLKIAWRYAQYTDTATRALAQKGSSSSTTAAPQSRSTASTTLSSAYDYQSSISSQLLASNTPTLLSIQEDVRDAIPLELQTDDEKTTLLVYRNTLERVCEFIASVPAGAVSRILLHSFGSFGWSGTPTPTSLRAMQLFLVHLRQIIANHSVLVMIGVTASFFPTSFLRLLSHSSHLVLSFSLFSASSLATQAVLGDYDGLLKLERNEPRNTLVPSTAAAAVVSSSNDSNAASSECYLYKLTRKKILIEKFALPPDAEETNEASDPASSSLQEASTTSHVPAMTTRGSAPIKSQARAPIAYEDPTDGTATLGANLARHGTSSTPTLSATALKAKERDASLHAIVQGRSSVPHPAGCSHTHQLPGHKMDF